MENINAVQTQNAFESWFDDYSTLAAKHGAETIAAIHRDIEAAARTGIIGNSPEVYDNARIAARYAIAATR